MEKKNNSLLLSFELILTLILFCVFLPNTFAMAEGESTPYGPYNGEQSFVAPEKGYYQLEVWGAQGGGNGGYGAYTTGVILLEKNQKIYIHVGSQGGQYAGGYNGGGNGGTGSKGQWGYGGGGATHIALASGTLSNLATNKPSILIVAAGGGGGCSAGNCPSGHGGGIKGMPGWDTVNNSNTAYVGTGATLTTGGYSYKGGPNCGAGSFGLGGPVCLNEGYGGAGGGGGFYGGGGSNRGHGAGGGGSSYMSEKLLTYGGITKATYCYDCSTGVSSAAGTRTISTMSANSSAVANTSKTGGGYAKITLKQIYYDPAIKEINLSSGKLDKTFDPEIYEYGVSLNSEISTITINATPVTSTSTITGLGTFNIPSGTTDKILISTSKSGDVATYILHITRPKSNYPYLQDIKVKGSSLPNFSPQRMTYEVNVPYTEEVLSLETVKGRTEQEVVTSDLSLHSGKNEVKITVTSEDGNNTVEYTLVVNREHTSKLKSLEVSDYGINPNFDPDTLTYNVEVLSHTMSLITTAIPYDEEAKVKIEGLGYIKTSATGKITVTEPNSTQTVYTINVTKVDAPVQTVFDFPFTGTIQTFTPTISAYYWLETWGSQGGGNGGYGAYSNGTVYLKRGETVYIGVGGTGAKYGGGYNGGGNGGAGNGQNAYGGGGATHIATSNGILSSLVTDKTSVLIVAAGGGGGCQNANCTYGHGGGYLGVNGYDVYNRSANAYNGTGASLTAGGYAVRDANPSCGRGSFGLGGPFCNLSYGGAGGGAGYYGGGGSNRGHGTGGGGSSYVGSTDLISYDKVIKGTYCYGCTASTVESQKTTATGNVSASPMSYYAKKGTGYARITMQRIPSENAFLDDLSVSVDGVKQTLSPEFSYNEFNYDVTLTDAEITSADIAATLADNTASLKGTGTVEVKAGENTYTITVTAENGAINNYNIHITRPASENAQPSNITISGLTPSLCNVNPIFCKLNPETFNPNTDSYEIRIPGKINQIWFNVEKGHAYQTVSGDGKVSLEEGENNITISITSEDGNNTNEYHYKVIRDMSDNPDLKELNIIDPVRDIGFNPGITDYSFSIPNEYTKIEMEIKPLGEYSTYVVIGNEELQVGTNQIIILVTAVSGDTKFYTLNVYREKNANVYLSNISVTNKSVEYKLTPEFNKLTTKTYRTTVPNDVTEVDVSALPEVSTTTVTGTGIKTLNTGTNYIQISTKAENADTETYFLEIIREKNANANLQSVTLKNGLTEYNVTPGFTADTTEYTLTVDGNVTYMNITATPEVSTTTYKLLENNSLKIGENIKHILAIAEDGTTKTYTITITRSISSDNYLKDIELSKGTLNPTFDPSENAYEIIVDNSVTSINVTGIKNDPKATVIGNGLYSLIVGINKIELTVTAEDGTQRAYVLTVIREKSNNAYLSNILLSKGTLDPAFTKETLTYNVFVSNDIDTIKIQGIPENKATKVSGNGEYDLTTGNNRFTLTTVAGDNKTSLTYEINVEREKSDNNKLKYLLLEEAMISPDFDPDTTVYTATVPNEIEQGIFHIETEDKNATYEIIGNTNFVVGTNEVIIRVKSEKGNTQDYKITIERQEDFTGSDYLASLSVSEGTLTPEFNKEQPYYEVSVPYTTDSIEITAEPEDKLASVNGPGTYTLTPGNNLIVITVTSTEGNIRDYQIIVKKEASNEARLSELSIDDSILSPNFQKDIFEYNVTTSENALTFNKVVPVDSNATYQILGNNFEDIGDYDVIIRVTAADQKTRKEYILHVEKTANNNNNLASLEVEGFTITPEFNKTTTLYNLTVDNNVNTIVIDAVPENPNAVVMGDGKQSLIPGKNEFVIQVISESGNVKSYTIVVTKKSSEINKLKDLIVNNGIMTPEFDPATDTYDVVVENSEEKLDLTVILESDASSYVVVDNHLSLGLNKVLILVTSESGDVFTYTLNVIRKEVVNALLENIKVKNYELSPVFNRYINNYNLLINNETDNLELMITPLDSGAKWQIAGTSEVHTGTDSVIVPGMTVGENAIQIEVKSSDESETETYTIHVTKQEKANDFLSYLYTSEGDLTPKFNKTTMEYTINVGESVSIIELFGEPEDITSTVTGLGTHNLTSGENKIPVTVTTSSGIKRVYYITVNKSKNSENSLLSLNIRSGFTNYDLSPEFNSNTLEYTVTVPVGTPNVTIEGTFPDTAKQSGLGTHDLTSGINEFPINITSESGDIKTYKITVIREKDTNNHLMDLIPSVGVLEPEFSYEETDYEITIDESASHLSFEVVTESNFATVSGTESQIIPDGTSTRIITVTAENGDIREYTITVNKERSDNALLSHLEVTGYSFTENFDPNKFEYHVTVPNNKKILFQSDIIATSEDENATIKMSENLNLVTTGDNEFIVTVTAKDGFTKQTYKIIITREKGSNALLNNLEIKKGKLETVFQPETFTYNWVIPSTTTVTKEDILPTPQDSNATFKIREEENKFIIKVTSEDGSTFKEYTLNITLDDNFDLESITPDETSIIIDIDETKQITYTLTPETTSFTEVKWISEDESIATVDSNGNITGVGYGTTIVHVVSTYDETIKGSIEVKVIRKKITSSVYTIERKEQEDGSKLEYTYGSEPAVLIKDYLTNFDNEEETLHVYDKEGNEVDKETDIASTFMKIKLIYEGKEYDELIIVIKGDITGDGFITGPDRVKLQRYMLMKIELEEVEKIAADLTNDGEVTGPDRVKLQRYMLMKISTVN